MFHIERVAETGSTNDDAQARLGEPGGAGVAIVADVQHHGRGRRSGRRWIAPPGSGLLFTATLPEPLHVHALWAVPFWTALAVADGVEAAAGLRLDLQWPNDLLLRDAKAGGILCISRISGDEAWIGCGVGINVHRPVHADLALGAVSPAPAFLDDVAPGTNRDVLLTAILTAFERRAGELASPARVARAWEARAALAGTPYRLAVDGEARAFDAVAERLGDAGELVVTLADGARRSVALGDAHVVRSP